MTVIDARIDQRLIHGIVVNQWNSKLNPKRFMVVDDVVSKQDEVKDSMRLSKPAGTGMSIIDTDKAIKNFQNGNYDEQRVFLIAKEPVTLIKLSDAGVKIPSINLGILFAEDGRTNVSKFVNLNAKEVADLKELESRGIPIRIQYVPENNSTSFEKAIEKHEFN